jgi:hypothetical protein
MECLSGIQYFQRIFKVTRLTQSQLCQMLKSRPIASNIGTIPTSLHERDYHSPGLHIPHLLPILSSETYYRQPQRHQISPLLEDELPIVRPGMPHLLETRVPGDPSVAP